MGANFQTATAPGTKLPQELTRDFDQIRARLTIEFGTDPYNGTWSTTKGLMVLPHVRFTSPDDAERWLEEHTEKWDFAKAVRVETEQKRYWLIGGWCAE